MISSLFPKLLSGKNLTFQESFKLFDLFFSGQLSDSECKAALVFLSQKGETLDEVRGCLASLSRYEPPARISVKGLLDTCGTGGDRSHSLNISTLAAIAAAGAGVKVAKHGNRAFTSKCGSSDLMESFGVRINAPRKTMIRSIQKSGLGYFHAPAHHPVISKFQPLRRSLKIKTILNLLGPLTNPLRLETKMVGTANRKTFDLYAEILKTMRLRRALVVYSPGENMDEISGVSPTQAALIEKGKVKYFYIDPSKLGFKKVKTRALLVTSVKNSRQKSFEILSGKERGPAADVVILNAAAAIWTAGKAVTLKEGIEIARRSISSGRALKKLEELVKNSKL